MNLLLIRPEELDADGVFSVSARQAEHLACVLHARIGGRVKTGVSGGRIGTAEILELDKKRARLRLVSLDREPPAKRPLRLAIALPRPQSFKKCLHFLASAGIPEACFIQTARVEKSYWTSAAMSPEAVEEEIFLGLEQGVDTVPPRLRFFHSFREWRESDFLQDGELRLVAHPGPSAASCPRGIPSRPVLAAIGPEGGFLADEVAAFEEMGFTPVEFGAHILRVEFALAFLAGRLS